MENQEIIARVVRPITSKSPAAAVVAFILDKAGSLLCSEQGDSKALAALKREVGKKAPTGRVVELEREMEALQGKILDLEAEIASLRGPSGNELRGLSDGNQGGQAAGEAG